MRNPAVIYRPPEMISFDLCLRTVLLFKPFDRSFFFLYTLNEIRRERVGQVGFAFVPPVRLLHEAKTYSLFSYGFIAHVYSLYLHEGNKQPTRVDRAGLERENPRPAGRCLHIYLSNTTRHEDLLFLILYAPGKTPPKSLPSKDLKSSSRVSSPRGPARADYSTANNPFIIITLMFKKSRGRVGKAISPLCSWQLEFQ